MSYATQIELAARLAPELLVLLADDDGDGAADTDVLDASLADSSAEIDQVLAGRYVTPVDPPPAVLVRWCVDLAVARLFQRKREALPGEHADQATLTRRALEQIAAGLAGLSGATPKPADYESENTQRGETPAFSEETLELY